MNIGFTGNRLGMSRRQMRVFKTIMMDLIMNTRTFHHGGCIGSDKQAHDIIFGIRNDKSINLTYPLSENVKIIVHPSNNPVSRADCTLDANDERLDEKPPLERDMDIAKSCDILFTTPRILREERRSGTWATIRYARKLGKMIVVLDP